MSSITLPSTSMLTALQSLRDNPPSSTANDDHLAQLQQYAADHGFAEQAGQIASLRMKLADGTASPGDLLELTQINEALQQKPQAATAPAFAADTLEPPTQPMGLSSPPLFHGFDDAALARLQQLGLDRGQSEFAEFLAGLRDELKQRGGISLLDVARLLSMLPSVLMAKPVQHRPPTSAPPATEPAVGITAAARELQIPVGDLNEMLGAGLSLADVAQRRGVSVDAVSNAVCGELAAQHPNFTDAQLDALTDGVMNHRADPAQTLQSATPENAVPARRYLRFIAP
jgi:hypothetical protein